VLGLGLSAQVLDVDERGRRVAAERTLVFLPHCEAELCDDLLAANAAAGTLRRLAVLGNSLRRGRVSIPRALLLGHALRVCACACPQNTDSTLHTSHGRGRSTSGASLSCRCCLTRKGVRTSQLQFVAGTLCECAQGVRELLCMHAQTGRRALAPRGVR